jgi:hypothetical protein
MTENKIITDIDQLTPEWLTRILKNKGYFNQGKVTKIIKKRSQETVSSNVHFLELNFLKDAQTEPASSEIVVKIPKPNDVSRFVGKHEAKFYRIVAEMMGEMPIPICYDAAFSEETGLSHTIIRNISKTHNIRGIMLGFLSSSSKRYFEKSIDCLAELHAFWWDHPKLKELSKHSYVLYTFKENSFNEEQIFKYFSNQNRNLKRFVKLFGDVMSDNRKDLIKTILSLYPQLAYDRIIKKNITVIHGDAHFWNFFYPNDISNPKTKAILSDWQLWSIGVGCQDLAYMIGLFFFPDFRHLIEKDLIKRYHNNLLKFGIKDYSWDDCWYDYKLFALLNIYRIFFWWELGMPSWQWWVRLESSLLTIEDLDCMELLES